MVIPVYNAMPWLRQAVESVVAQTIDSDAVEIIAVDDCSTDGSGEELDVLAERHRRLRVVHLAENSGGAGEPRNVGMTAARGEYLFFLDADDYLGTEALGKMLAMARRAGSDIVLGATAPVLGRGRGHRRGWSQDVERAEIVDGGVYEWLDAHKLFRRAFVDELGIGFVKGPRAGSDLEFVSYAYLCARVISVVADYDCYYVRDRGDAPAAADDALEFISRVDAIAHTIADHVPEGGGRDRLLERHVRREVLDEALGGRWFDEMSDEDRAALVAAAREFCAHWMTPSVFAALPPIFRVMAHCLVNDLSEELTDIVRFQRFGDPVKDIVDGGRVYAGLPFFRNPAAAIPDVCYDRTPNLRPRRRLREMDWHGTKLRLAGHAFIPHIDTDEQTVTVVLRERDSGAELGVQARGTRTPELAAGPHDGRYEYGYAGFVAYLDLGRLADGRPLPDGRWEVWVEVCAHGVTMRRRLDTPGEYAQRRHKLMSLDVGTPALVTTSATKRGELVLSVAARNASTMDLMRLTECESTRTHYAVAAHGHLESWPKDATAELCLVRGKRIKTVRATVENTDEGIGVKATLLPPRLRLASGWWGLGMRLSWSNNHFELPVHDAAGKQVWLQGRPTLRELFGRVRGSVRA